MLGALALDYVKPKRMIIAMLIVQAVIGKSRALLDPR